MIWVAVGLLLWLTVGTWAAMRIGRVVQHAEVVEFQVRQRHQVERSRPATSQPMRSR